MTMTMNRVLTEDTFRGYLARAEDTGDLTFVAVTAGVKRDGLEIVLDGLSTDNFMRNPVVLWVHDYNGRVLPIGRVTSITRQTDSLVVTIHFDDNDPFAQEIRRKYVDGYLFAVSIGWDTLASDGSRITESDLLDVSAVPVPGDQDALLQRADEYARSLRSPTDPMEVVSVEQPEDRPLTRAATVEQIDQTMIALQSLRDELAETEPDPEVEDPGPLEDLQALLGDTDE